MTTMLRASSFGSCLKAQVADHLGMKSLPTSERMQGFYDRGNEHEDACLLAMKAAGWDICPPGWEQFYGVAVDWDDGQIFVGLSGEGWGITGHLDGIAENLPRGPRVLEIKAPATWANFERAVRTNAFTDPYMNRIAWQVSVYMVATGLEAVLACWTEEHGVRMFGIETPIYDRAAIEARASEIAEMVTRVGAVPDACSQADWPCPFAYLHDDRGEVVEDEELDDLASDYASYAEVEKQARIMKDMSRDALLAHGGGETASYKVTVSDATTSRYDYRAIEKALGRPLDEFKTETTSQRVRVTAKDADAGP